MEILHKDRLAKLADPAARAEEEREFRHEKRRVEDDRDRKIAKIRTGENRGA